MNRYALGLIMAGLAIGAAVPAEEAPTPLVRAHAHNDYQHERPLLDALDHGFCSVEADIHLVDGALLVAHDLDQCRPDRTLEALYLDPLRGRVAKNGGRVYPDGPGFTLLIDIKSGTEDTYAALHDVLEGYADILTEFRKKKTIERAVIALVSGNRPVRTMAAQSPRYAALDGRPPDLRRDPPVSLVPLVSSAWGSVFSESEDGRLSDGDRAKLEQMIQQAHDQGRRIRFWGVPGGMGLWPLLYDLGVDLINADDLGIAQTFLLDKMKEETGK